jgi:5'-3' exonuclease
LSSYPAAYTNATPQVFDGIVFAGFSPPEGDSNGIGGFVLLDAEDGQTLVTTPTIAPADVAKGYAGGERRRKRLTPPATAGRVVHSRRVCWSPTGCPNSWLDRGVLLLLDTPSLYFRAFYGVPDSITAPDGTPVNAIRGLLDFTARLIRDFTPTHVVAAMDADWRPKWRVDALPSYKAHRVGPAGGDQTPPGLEMQVPIIEEVLDALGIARVGVAGYEADDVIGTLATEAAGPVDIVTGDRDLFQLVRDDQPVRVIYTARGVGNATAWDEAAVEAKYGIPGRGYAEFATLRGDPSDGLPGVPGVGEKTAAALIKHFGTVESMLAAARDGEDTGFPSGARAKVLAATDYLDRAPLVVRVACDVPLPDFDGQLAGLPKDPERLVALADRWALDSSLNRLLAAVGQATAE